MFDNNLRSEQSSQECKPDPEVMLQQARKRKEDVKKADDLLTEFIQIPIHISERDIDDSLLRILGTLRIELFKTERDEAFWLAEINKTTK